MSVAQDLFGHGLITYHRTDSTRVEPTKIQELRDKIEQDYGKRYLSPSVINYGPSDGSQDAHEAIRPTYDTPVSALGKDEKKLLNLIENRFVASQMADAEYDQVSVKLEIQDKKAYCFKQTGSVLTFDGFLKVYGEVKEDLILPQMAVGDEFAWSALNTQQHYTKPPPRYSDASIIKILEKEGVGRPSTYASILETLTERSYIEKNGKALGATQIGIMVSDFLTERFPEIVDTGFTSDMESKLDQMADGKVEFKDFIKSFNTSLDEMLVKATSSQMPQAFEVEHQCPKCSSNMVKKISKHGPFLGCKNWPTCDGVLTIEGQKNSEDKVETGHSCPKCSNILILRKGKNGNFFGCKAYPNCKYTAPVGEDGTPTESVKESPKDTGVKCPKCGKGHMQERTGKFGKFFGCSAYPKCKNIMKSIDNTTTKEE
jgi:DNA topoisomerase-1